MKNPHVQFYVRDTGIGIPKDKLNIIFESFRQVHVLGHRIYGGTGLGLAITKKMVEILGGYLGRINTRTGFHIYFTLPFNPTHKAQPSGKKEARQAGIIKL
ncbi:MAG: ATP-binding protein [Bacteroidales bacterium]